jgi:Hypothetical glycosyl hydrolase family 15
VRRLLAIVGAGLVAAAGAVGISRLTATATAGGPVAGDVRGILEDQSDVNYNWATVAPKFAAIDLNAWDYSWIPAIKRANPNVKVFEYKDLTSTRPGACAQSRDGLDNSELPTGVDYCWARSHHPEWFLTRGGRPAAESGYPDQYLMNYADPAYQAQWLANVTADATSHGWDGVEMDNALVQASEYGGSDQFSSDAAVQVATTAMLQVVGSGLQAHGIIAVANVGYATQYPGLWQQWLGLTSGLEQEFYLSWSHSPDVTDPAGWQQYEEMVSSCAAQAKYCWFHVGRYDKGVSQQTVDYTLASYLLQADGTSYYAYGDTTSSASLSLGPALDRARQVGGLWERDFQCGSVSVDVTAGTGHISSDPSCSKTAPGPLPATSRQTSPPGPTTTLGAVPKPVAPTPTTKPPAGQRPSSPGPPSPIRWRCTGVQQSPTGSLRLTCAPST